MAWRDVDIGAVSAYAIAVEHGYKGTEEEWARDQANAGTNGAIARESAEAAKADAEAAKNALNSLAPKTQESLAAIEAKGDEQVTAVQSEGKTQVKAVQDTGAEQSEVLAAQGDVEQRKVVAAGDEQVARVTAAGDTEVQDITDAVTAGVADVQAATEEKKQEAVEAVQAAQTTAENSIVAKGESTLANIPDDYSSLAAQVLTKAPAIECDASGALVTVGDAAAQRAVQAVSTIAAVQSGTGDPSPDNVRPISGFGAVILSRTQKNMLGFEDFSFTASTGAYTDTCTDGVFRREVSQYVTTTFAVATTALQYLKHPCIPAGTYTFTATYTGSATYTGLYLEVTLSDGTIAKLPNGEPTTIALGGTITGVRMTSKGFTAGTVIECTMQLEAGAGTSYEPYSGATLTATLPETVYGGSLDWTTGVLTATHYVKTLDGTEAWADGGSNAGVYALDYGVLSTVQTDNQRAYHICSHYKPVKYASATLQTDMTAYTVNATRLLIKDTSHGEEGDTTDVKLNNFKAYLADQAAEGKPVTLVWPLKPASHRTIQLTPQQLDMLKGENHVWSDSGDTRLVYIADTKMYIDNALAAIAASIINA